MIMFEGTRVAYTGCYMYLKVECTQRLWLFCSEQCQYRAYCKASSETDVEGAPKLMHFAFHMF